MFTVTPARFFYQVLFLLKDTHTEKTPLNKTPSLSKSMNIDVWVVGTSNQLFV